MHPLAIAVSAALGASVEGTWHTPDARQVAEDVKAAVETAIDGFSVAERPIARWLLVRATKPCGTVQVEVRAAELAIRCDEQQTAVAPSDGTPVAFAGNDGRELTLVHDVVDDRTVTQSFRSREGTRTNRLTLRPDGSLEVAVTIRSQRLSSPLEYTLTYLR